MNTKRIFREALPGQPTKKTSVDEDRWMIVVKCHTKSNHVFQTITHIAGEILNSEHESASREIAATIRRAMRFARESVEMSNKEVGEKSGKRRVRTSAATSR